jgi:hypothetical protein
MTALKGGGIVVATRQSIIVSQVSMEGIRPKFGIKTSAGKHVTESIADGLMGTLNWSILMRAVGTSSVDVIFMALEETMHLRIAVKLTTLVKKNLLSRDIGSVMLEPMIKPCDASTLQICGAPSRVPMV